MLRYLCRFVQANGRTGYNTCSKFVPILARALSTGDIPNTKTPNSTNETLSLLHRAITLLPQTLNIKRSSSSTRAEETADFWNGILSNVYEDLSATTKRPARIVGLCTPIILLLIEALVVYLFPSMWPR
jgi:hypothetical protein